MPFFEIGGMIYETTYRGTTKGLDSLSRTRSSSDSTHRSTTVDKIVKNQEQQPDIQETSTSIWKDEGDFWKGRAGTAAVGTGVKIARAAAIAATVDGPLPVGDVIAAGIDVMTNAVGKNNDLPYVQDDYPGGKTQLPGLQVHDTSSYTSTTIGGQFYAKGGNFPCGIIKISHANTGDISAGLSLQLDLVPGHHRGYMCESMTEM